MAPVNPGSSMENVVINEIMFNPGPNRTEWIELYNRGSGVVDLAGSALRLDHLERVRLISSGGLSIEGQGYVVIAHDVALFRETHPGFGGTVVEAPGAGKDYGTAVRGYGFWMQWENPSMARNTTRLRIPIRVVPWNW